MIARNNKVYERFTLVSTGKFARCLMEESFLPGSPTDEVEQSGKATQIRTHTQLEKRE
jgi:hypothetical protein